MLKFLLYHSKSAQSFTLLFEDSLQKNTLLEDDAELLHTIWADTWPEAVTVKNDYINSLGD